MNQGRKYSNNKKLHRQPRPEALMIKRMESISYAEMLRKVKEDAEFKELGTNVTRVILMMTSARSNM